MVGFEFVCLLFGFLTDAVVQHIEMSTTHGFIIRIPQGELVARADNAAVFVKSQVMRRQFHTTVYLAIRFVQV